MTFNPGMAVQGRMEHGFQANNKASRCCQVVNDLLRGTGDRWTYESHPDDGAKRACSRDGGDTGRGAEL